VRRSEDVDYKEQPVVSQTDAEAREVTSTPSCCCIPTGVFRRFTSTHGRSNIDHPQRSVNDAISDQPKREGQGPNKEDAQSHGVYFPTIGENSMT
jgi:hypothetical protein